MIPVINVSADTTDVTNENTNTETNLNTWKDSDIRKFLNTGAADANSTTKSVNSRGYASHFTKEEYGIIMPSTVTTINNEVSNNGVITTDRFVLPSGRYISSINVLSWGQDDISKKNNFEDKEKRYLIPRSYWAGGVNNGAWIRSASEESDKAFIAERCKSLTSTKVDSKQYVAPFFRIDISDVHFASMVSASELLIDEQNTVVKNTYEIEKDESLGNLDNIVSKNYGMYLKTKLESFFKIENIDTPYDSKLQVDYKNGDIGKAIVVQMYEKDDIDDINDIDGTLSIYTVVFKIKEVNGSVYIDISDWNDVVLNKRNYTLKVWMEDLSTGASLAKATEPQTFACSEGLDWNEVVGDTEIEKLPKNTRAFAMKNELKCSWGDLSKCADTVIAGGYNDSSYYDGDSFCVGRNVGVFATNQKIYYGIYDNGNPIEFWIAGRETGNDSGSYNYADDDEIKNNSSNIMCLYQTSAIDNDKRAFKGGTNSYQVELSIKHNISQLNCMGTGGQITVKQ
ncbi:MAG: hypothetical protein IJ272_04795, partial [Clostridia bacterium]|nr:hypothetical protein [Clostridia bacterium]